MPTIAAQIAPQRSTQYADFVRTLAPYELALCLPCAGPIEAVTLGGQDYLRFEVNDESDPHMLAALGDMAMLDACFTYHEQIGEVRGPFLQPLDLPQQNFMPPSLVVTRRYRGKTNELLTRFMVHIARATSDDRDTPWHRLTLLDPLAGGGTTLFVGLTYGADVVGVEQDKKVTEGTVAFLRQFCKEMKLPAHFHEDRLKNTGKRWFVTLGESLRCVIGHGDTTDVRHFTHGLKQPQIIVTDLPYGIQHRAEWLALLVDALPAWADVLAAGGVLVFSWNATRFPRAEMIDLVESASDFAVLNDPPYDQLAHRVDRVIKQRDLIVARLA